MVDLPLSLRPTRQEDLEFLFTFQLDEEGIQMAAFTPANPTDRAAYLSKYAKLLQEPTVHMKTIYFDEVIVGSISKFELEGKAEITYWIDREYWGRSVASSALKTFLTMENMRPIYGRVAFDNIGSQKVLEKSGFIKIGEDHGFANARQAEIREYIYRLD